MRLTMLRHDSMLKPLVRRSLSAGPNSKWWLGPIPNRPYRFFLGAKPHILGQNPPCLGLTFADDAVEDGLKLGDADFHVLGGEMGAVSVTPVSPAPRSLRSPYRPRELLEELLEVGVDLAFREHFLGEKRAVLGPGVEGRKG